MILRQTPRGDKVYDLWSYLLKNRIIYLSGHIEPDVADSIIGQLLFLESQDPDANIYLYINSPGGNVISGLAIYDIMQYIEPPVCTICVGQANSMAAVLLSSGAKHRRFIYPHAEVMIHKVSAGYYGKEPDIEISANRIKALNKTLVGILARNTGKTLDELMQETDRDNFFTADEAVEFGLVDEVIGYHGHRDGERF